MCANAQCFRMDLNKKSKNEVNPEKDKQKLTFIKNSCSCRPTQFCIPFFLPRLTLIRSNFITLHCVKVDLDKRFSFKVILSQNIWNIEVQQNMKLKSSTVGFQILGFHCFHFIFKFLTLLLSQPEAKVATLKFGCTNKFFLFSSLNFWSEN